MFLVPHRVPHRPTLAPRCPTTVIVDKIKQERAKREQKYFSAYHKHPARMQPAHSGPVASGFNIAQDPLPQPLTLPGAQGQLCQEHTITQPASFIPGHSYRQFSATRLSVRSKLSRECRALWQRLRRYFGLFLLHMRPIQF